MAKYDIAAENFIDESLNNWTEHLNRVHGTRTISAKYKAMEWSREGYLIKDTKGNEYIDFLGGCGILEPPLMIDEKIVDEVIGRFDEALRELMK